MGDGTDKASRDAERTLDEIAAAATRHGPPEDGDTCPRCGSRYTEYEPGFAEGAENKYSACGFVSFYLW